MNKDQVIASIIGNHRTSPIPEAEAFAPANIALCKYWGKRNEEINLPVTSSLSISLGSKGTQTALSICSDHDVLIINDQEISRDDPALKRLSRFLDLFRSPTAPCFHVKSYSTIPLAAGLASSASGFASIVMALDRLMGWNLSRRELSILSRLGSGSASRSVYHGFAEWHAGSSADGMDSFAEPIETDWTSLRLGLLTISGEKKKVSSRDGMRQTVETCGLYKAWPAHVQGDLEKLRHAITNKDFPLLGATAEHNALAMHATMIATWPPVCYWLPESIAAMQKVWQARESGLALYFTMDAGPNLKLLFEEKDTQDVLTAFPAVEVINPFVYPGTSAL